MSNELDMDAYHEEGINPGEHKVFSIAPTIHSFNDRFQGTSDFGKGNSDTFNQRFEGEPGSLPIIPFDKAGENTDLKNHLSPWPGRLTDLKGEGTISNPVYQEQKDLDLYEAVGEVRLPGLLGAMVDLAKQTDRLPPAKEKEFTESLQKLINKHMSEKLPEKITEAKPAERQMPSAPRPFDPSLFK